MKMKLLGREILTNSNAIYERERYFVVDELQQMRREDRNITDHAEILRLLNQSKFATIAMANENEPSDHAMH